MSRLCLTIGDPTGIGPEITAKFLACCTHNYPDSRFIVIGDFAAVVAMAQQLDLPLPESGNLEIIDIQESLPGMTAYRSLEKAVEHLASGQADGMVTGPISKENLHQAGILAQGHTEILELLARRFYTDCQDKAQMLFTYEQFRVFLLTRHVPLNRVTNALRGMNIRQPLETLYTYLTRDMAISAPRIAVLGVNPHAGEIGGVEESLLLSPVLAELNTFTRARWEGPFAADALFREFDADAVPYDAYVAAYHDQGLIPMKLIGGYKAVNVTIGLPFIRTSVSHGTAPDIAGQGIAKVDSLVAAVEEARRLVGIRQQVIA